MAATKLFLQRSVSNAFRGKLSMTAGLRMHHTHSGKVALVTGSTEGIGFAIAKRLGQDGAKVIINSRKQEKVDHAVEQLKKENIDVLGVAGHAGKSQDRENIVTKAVEHFGGLDILVNNVGTSPYVGATSQTPESVWDKLFDTNVKSGFFMTQTCLPHLQKRGGGNVIFVTSILGYQHEDLLGVYSITKLALVGVVKTLSTELAASNIRVNGIAPGIIKTKFSTHLTETPELGEKIFKQIPLKRFGEPDDCSGVVSFLTSEDASYITGETVVVTGGMTSRL